MPLLSLRFLSVLFMVCRLVFHVWFQPLMKRKLTHRMSVGSTEDSVFCFFVGLLGFCSFCVVIVFMLLFSKNEPWIFATYPGNGKRQINTGTLNCFPLLTCKHKDLSWDSYHPRKKPDMATCSCDSSAEVPLFSQFSFYETPLLHQCFQNWFWPSGKIFSTKIKETS